MQTVKIVKDAAKHTRYTADACVGMIGEEIPVTANKGELVTARVVAAVVAADGRSLELTLQLPDGTIPPGPEALRGVSVDEKAAPYTSDEFWYDVRERADRVRSIVIEDALRSIAEQ